MSINTDNLKNITDDLEMKVEDTTADARRYINTLRAELNRIEERLDAGVDSGHRCPETLRLIEALTARDANLRTLKAINFHTK